MSSIAWFWLSFLGFVLVLATSGYWLYPLWRWIGPSRLPARTPALAAVRVRSLLPLPLEAALERHRAPLEALGFEAQVPVRDARDAGKVRGGPSGVTQRWRHPVHGDMAYVIVSPTGTANAVAVLAFATRLADGTSIETGNMPFAPDYPPMPGVRRARFRDERAPQRLYALHRARVAEGGSSVPHPDAEPVAAQQAIEQAAHDWFVASGYMRRRGDRLRYTLRGAFLGCWRQLPPWSWLEARRNEQERRRLLPLAKLPRATGHEKSVSARLLFE